MPKWGRSPGWPTRNSSTRTCCSSDPWPVTSSGRDCFLTSLRPSRDNSACGRSRRESQRPDAKLHCGWVTSVWGSRSKFDRKTPCNALCALRCDVLVMPQHVLRVVAALQRDEPLVLFGAVYRTEAVGGLIGHEIHIGAGRERPHRLPGLADPGDVAVGFGVVRLPGPHDIHVVLRFAV